MEKAVTVAVFGRQVICEVGEALLPCRIVGSLLRRNGPLAAGDRVLVERSGDEGIVRQLEDRSTALRRAPRLPRHPPLIVAANVDQVLAVLSVREPPFRSGLADRILAAASICGIEAALCVNKWDLAAEGEESLLDDYAAYPTVCTSSLDGHGLDELRQRLEGRRTVAVGHSGVGKSSLLNRLVPGLDARVREVNGVTGRGRHTTTTATLVHLPGGGTLIDTPGIRAFGLIDVTAKDLAGHFPEFTDHADLCEFEDCQHGTETGCGVREAAETGTIPRTRYDGYLRIRESLMAGRG